MPIEYTIDVARGLIYTRGWDSVGDTEFQAYIANLIADPANRPGMKQLSDWRAVTQADVTAETVRATAEIMRALVERQRHEPSFTHHQLAIVSPARQPRLACPSTGWPAGLMPSNPVESETVPFSPGDTFVLFSDGVSEAMNPAEEFYGEERLMAVLAGTSGATAADTVQRVLADVRAFSAGAKQSDDITVVAARYAHVAAPITDARRSDVEMA